jgi:hypothetical protein
MLNGQKGLAGKLVFSYLISNCLCLPVTEIAQIRRDVTELNDSYDYIVVGGGTSGLTVANRLSADGTSEKALQRPVIFRVYRANAHLNRNCSRRRIWVSRAR